MSDGNGHTVVTNAGRLYTLSDLLPGSYTVTPTLAGHAFTPSSRSLSITNADVANADFSATLLTYAISGMITLDGQPLAGVTVSDGNGHTVVTNDGGYYELTGLLPDTYVVAPTLDGHSFEPPSATVSVVDMGVVQNFNAYVVP